jgi:hypothetical protein
MSSRSYISAGGTRSQLPTPEVPEKTEATEKGINTEERGNRGSGSAVGHRPSDSVGVLGPRSARPGRVGGSQTEMAQFAPATCVCDPPALSSCRPKAGGPKAPYSRRQQHREATERQLLPKTAEIVPPSVSVPPGLRSLRFGIGPNRFSVYTLRAYKLLDTGAPARADTEAAKVANKIGPD